MKSPISEQNSLSSRMYRLSLSEPPELASFGAYGDDAPLMEWTQTPGRFHVMLIFNDGMFSLNGSITPFRHGGLFVVPPGSRCRVEATSPGDHVHCFISFYPVDSGKDVYLVPFFTQFSRSESDVWEYQIRRALRMMSQSRTPNFAVAWSLLWRVAQPLTAIDANPVIELSLRWIEEHIREKISIKELAAAMDISHNQLIRHFRQELGITPVQFVRERRADVARRLLTTTARPIKTIAHEVGVPNLHSFNRLIRECLGMSPRQVRRSRQDLDYFRAGALD